MLSGVQRKLYKQNYVEIEPKWNVKDNNNATKEEWMVQQKQNQSGMLSSKADECRRCELGRNRTKVEC